MSNISNLNQCPVCLGKIYKDQKFKYLEKYNLENEEFSLFECPLCLVKFWYPFKNPGSEWYKNCQQNLMHRDFSDKEYFFWLAENRGITKHFFRNPPHQNPKGLKLLDVGCGTGGFLIEAQKFGYDVNGVDFDGEQIKVAQSFGLKETYEDDVVDFLNRHKGEFDVITGFEIIEHVDKPRDFLKAIYGALKSGGFICLSTPNNSRIGPRDEFWDFPYHHLSRWTKKSLENIIKLENFKFIKIKEEIPINYLIPKFRVGLGVFVRKYFTNKDKEKFNQNKKTEYKDTVAKLGSLKDKILHLILLPIATLLFIFGKKGQGLYLIAKK